MNLTEIRHYLHQYPEVSDCEGDTAEYIVKTLKKLGLSSIHHDFFEEAILAEINADKPGNTVLVRCELDALPIKETNTDLSYSSTNAGVSHKCGHDGHMTILLGLAEKLMQTPPKTGKILLLFQPSEENGRGVKGILKSGMLKNYTIDFIFALHNVPGFPLGSVVCRSGNFTPSVESLEVELIGKTSHAGMPEKGVSPALAIARLIQYYQELHQPKRDDSNYFLSTPIQLQMGQPAYGTSAGHGLVSYTFRADDHTLFKKRKTAIEIQTKALVKETPGLKCKLNWKEGFEANKNTPEAYALIKKAALHNEMDFIEKEAPFSWGEDFGALTQQFPGAMFGLGSGENQPELHNPDFDFPDELIDKGIAMFYELIKLTR